MCWVDTRVLHPTTDEVLPLWLCCCSLLRSHPSKHSMMRALCHHPHQKQPSSTAEQQCALLTPAAVTWCRDCTAVCIQSRRCSCWGCLLQCVLMAGAALPAEGLRSSGLCWQGLQLHSAGCWQQCCLALCAVKCRLAGKLDREVALWARQCCRSTTCLLMASIASLCNLVCCVDPPPQQGIGMQCRSSTFKCTVDRQVGCSW